jgi:dinuclear metal center YbgI/SA1388 family protein
MKIKEVIKYLEQIAPPVYQEGYDNAGLIVGDAEAEVKGVLICLDSTEAVIGEAVEKGCNLVIAHHPIIFKGLKKITGRHYVERVVIEAIRHGVAICAIHTNLDNVYHRGVNAKIAERLGLVNTRLLSPKPALKKLSSLVPALHQQQVEKALIKAGAEQVAFTHQTTYSTLTVHSGNGFEAEYLKMEALFAAAHRREIVNALQRSQPDQQVHYDITSVENLSDTVGAGMFGTLAQPMNEREFLLTVKKRMNAACIRHTPLLGQPVEKVAVCGGAGGLLLSHAIAMQADVFITADYKYHEFFDADGRIVIADVGHYESEQFTIELLYELVSNKFSNFAAYCTKVNTNPVHYLC